MRSIFVAAACLLAPAALACTAPAAEVRGTAVAPPPVMVQGNVVPAGAQLVARLEVPIGTDISTPGQVYTAVIVGGVTNADGVQLIPEGSRIRGRVVDLRQGSSGELAVVELSVEALELHGRTRPVGAHIVRTNVEADRDHRSRPILGGAAGGALIGAVLGGGSGALKGAAVGAGAGTVISLGTAKDQAKMPVGSELTIEFDQPLQTR